MKVATIIIRTLMGAMYLFASISYFFLHPEMPKMEGALLKFNEGLAASGYMFPLVKTLELICGLALVSGFFVPLAAVIILPVTVNIFMVNLFMMPDGLLIAALLLAANIFVLYSKRSHYKEIYLR